MTGRLIARQLLTPEQRARMLEILATHFDHITPERFAQDLNDKNWVILILNDAGGIAGFSTLHFYRAEFEGAPIAVVYSGDTIIEREAWGSPALPRTWIDAVWQLHESQCPTLPLYWLLLTSGYRTYRFLSVFWRHFYPVHDAPTPSDLRRLLCQLASERFTTGLDLDAGVVHLGQPLRQDLLPIPDARLHDPDIAFFLQRNPGYIRGDELLCIARLSRDNLTPAGWRMVLGHSPRAVEK